VRRKNRQVSIGDTEFSALAGFSADEVVQKAMLVLDVLQRETQRCPHAISYAASSSHPFAPRHSAVNPKPVAATLMHFWEFRRQPIRDLNLSGFRVGLLPKYKSTPAGFVQEHVFVRCKSIQGGVKRGTILLATPERSRGSMVCPALE
jgi:hypothetical protein